MRNRKRFGYCAGYVFSIAITIGAVAGNVPRCAAQNANVDQPHGLRFEVASIRRAPDFATVASQMALGKPPHVGTRIDREMVDMGSASLMRLFCDAYSIPSPAQVSGPDWMASQRFDVLGKLPAGATKEQLPELLQTLLQERFGLSFHRASRLETAYVLLAGPKGHKLAPAIPDDPEPGPDAKASSPEGHGFGGNSVPAQIMGKGPNGTQRVSISNGVVHIEFYGITTKGLADYFRTFLGRPVVDLTGLEGKYHVVLEHAMSEAPAANAVAPAAPGGDSSVAADSPSEWVFAATNKLGLKLESRKVSMEQLVIDHIEKLPTEN